MTIPEHIQQAIQAYYAERATDEDVAALESWFREDNAHARVFAEHGMLEWQMHCEQQKADAAAVMTMLLEADKNAEPDFSLLQQPVYEPAKTDADVDSLAVHDFVAVGAYAFRLALTSKPAKRVYAYAGVAAALLLAFVLFNPWAGSNTPDAQPFADNTPDKPEDPAQSTPRVPIVATLTATHNAQWGGPASVGLASGAPLHPGDRLTLAAGFAEITTVRGAVAVLQAPCTIELTRSDNALILHHGRMLGICLIESSKGFLVQTAHADIVDLGTEFGVQASDGKVITTVFTGAVEMTPDNGEPQPLTENQTARLDTVIDAQTLVIHDEIAEGFDTLRSRPELSPVQRWQQHLAQLKQSHGLIGQISFDDNGLVTTSGKNATTFDPQIIGGTIRPGNASKGTAASLAISDDAHGVDLSLDPSVKYNRLTLVTWMRINAAPGQVIATLMHRINDTQPRAIPAWHIRHDEQTLVIDQRAQNMTQEEMQALNQTSLPADWEGRWRCFVAVLNMDTRRVEHYMDGRHIGSSQMLLPGPVSMGKVRIGALMNSYLQINETRYINGDCGPFLLLDQALSPDQVHRLYQESNGLFGPTN